jgi:hypothetical protein
MSLTLLFRMAMDSSLEIFLKITRVTVLVIASCTSLNFGDSRCGAAFSLSASKI